MTQDPDNDLLSSEQEGDAVENTVHPVVYQRLASFRTDRCTPQILAFVEAMTHEMEDNHHKGHWLEEAMFEKDGVTVAHKWRRDTPDFLSDLMYHMFKLVMACRSGDMVAVLEYVADVGNCAWFVADHFDLLSVPIENMHQGPIEYEKERMDGVTQAQLNELKKGAKQLVSAMMHEMEGKMVYVSYSHGPDNSNPGDL